MKYYRIEYLFNLSSSNAYKHIYVATETCGSIFTKKIACLNGGNMITCGSISPFNKLVTYKRYKKHWKIKRIKAEEFFIHCI